MMKKTYMTPMTETIELNECQTLLAGSGVTANDINYGGVDTDGSLDPAAPEFINF